MNLRFNTSWKIGITIFLISIYSCYNKGRENISYYDNGSIKNIVVGLKEDSLKKIEYEFYPDGELKKISRFDRNGLINGEQLWFYSSGRLDRKLHYSNDELNGNAYFFYDTTGALKHFRFFQNSYEILFGVDYWGDSMDLIKSSLHFNRNGQLFYKKNFDENGELISEEGKK